MPGLRNTIPIGATMGAVLLTLGVGFWKGREPVFKEFRQIEARVNTSPATAVTSASALVAVLVAWRSFTGYRRGMN